jgi:hypothetical protein
MKRVEFIPSPADYFGTAIFYQRLRLLTHTGSVLRRFLIPWRERIRAMPDLMGKWIATGALTE